MRIIQSTWQTPKFNDEYKGSFLTLQYHYYTWALSCLQFKRFYPKLQLVSDAWGKEVLIDKIGLPYDEVTIFSNDFIEKYRSCPLFIVGKLYAYSIQKEPFIHVDGDVLTWEHLGKKLENVPLVAQNLEHGSSWYHNTLPFINEHFKYLPNAMRDVYKSTSPYKYSASNAGIIGGKAIDFFQEYTREAFCIIDQNPNYIQTLDPTALNVCIEQHLFLALAAQKGIPISYYYPKPIAEDFSAIQKFNLVSHYLKFIHLINLTKKEIMACEQVEARLAYHYPIFHQRIKELIQSNTTKYNSSQAQAQQQAARFKRLHQLFVYLDDRSEKYLLQQKIVLNPNVETIEREEVIFLTFFSVATRSHGYTTSVVSRM